MKIVFAKPPPKMFGRVLNNNSFYFDEYYSPQLLTPPLNLYIWCKIPAHSLITPSPHPAITLPRTMIFKTGFRKLSILSKFYEWRMLQGVGGRLVCVIMMHCVRKFICDSPLSVCISIYLKFTNGKGTFKIAIIVHSLKYWKWKKRESQLIFTCSKSTIETLEKGLKNVQS